MGILSSKPFVVIDLGSGRYVQTKVGHKFIIEISKYNTYMFRQQRFFKGKYISLDKKIISYLEKYLENNSNFLCEADPSHQTFMTSKGVPYMEGHHLIPCTAKNAKTFWKRVGKSIDCVENIVCLCPTCHRKIHFGSEAEKRSIIKLLYNKQHSKLKKQDWIFQRKNS